MKAVIYRGFRLTVEKEKCLAGWDMTYYSAVRVSDGWEMISSFSESEDTLESFIDGMKCNIDDYYRNPKEWEDD